MKRYCVFVFLIVASCSQLFAQDNNDLALAKQFAANGEQQKALDIYQKLYKQDNEANYLVYYTNLLAFKKFDEAMAIAKKMIRRHPEDHQYVIQLGAIYTQQGALEK